MIEITFQFIAACRQNNKTNCNYATNISLSQSDGGGITDMSYKTNYYNWVIIVKLVRHWVLTTLRVASDCSF